MLAIKAMKEKDKTKLEIQKYCTKKQEEFLYKNKDGKNKTEKKKLGKNYKQINLKRTPENSVHFFEIAYELIKKHKPKTLIIKDKNSKNKFVYQEYLGINKHILKRYNIFDSRTKRYLTKKK